MTGVLTSLNIYSQLEVISSTNLRRIPLTSETIMSEETKCRQVAYTLNQPSLEVVSPETKPLTILDLYTKSPAVFIKPVSEGMVHCIRLSPKQLSADLKNYWSGNDHVFTTNYALLSMIRHWRCNFETEIILGNANGSYSIGAAYYKHDEEIPDLNTGSGKARFLSRATIVNSNEVSNFNTRILYDRWEPYLVNRQKLGDLVIGVIDRNLVGDELPRITTRTTLTDVKFYGLGELPRCFWDGAENNVD